MQVVEVECGDQLVERELPGPPQRDQFRQELLRVRVTLDDTGDAPAHQERRLVECHGVAAPAQSDGHATSGRSQHRHRGGQHLGRADGIDGVVGAAAGRRTQLLREVGFGAVEHRGRTEGERQFPPCGQRIDDNDRRAFGNHRGQHGSQTDRPAAEHDDGRARARTQHSQHRTSPGLDAATERAQEFDRQVACDLDGVGRGNNGVRREGGLTEPVALQCNGIHRQGGAAVGSATGVVTERESRAVRRMPIGAIDAVAARRVAEQHVIPGDQGVDGAADRLHHAGPFVAEHRGDGNGNAPGRGREIGVTDADSGYPYEHFVVSQITHFDVADLQWLTVGPENGSTGSSSHYTPKRLRTAINFAASVAPTTLAREPLQPNDIVDTSREQ
ncbi:hypothetical protein RHCRD62_50060 [Rhodococcus sp. RD6.2]|nr:hypothetical protein RHCRD62_50060 [Rhodococcus sp. RD6.2]